MKQRGFTLIEAVIVMVVVSIIGYIVFVAVERGVRAYITSGERRDALDETRIALERMTRELREMRGLLGNTATYVCFNTLDGQKVSFRYESPYIKREEDWAVCPGAGGNTLAGGITDFTLSFMNASGVTAPPAEVRRIRLRLGTSFPDKTPVELESEAYLRNFQ